MTIMDIFEDQSVVESSCSTYLGDAVQPKGSITIACKRTGLDIPTALTVTEDQQRLSFGQKDKCVTLLAVKQLVYMDRSTEDCFSSVERNSWPLTLVHITWGRVKKLQLKFWDLDTYQEWVALLTTLCPQAQVVQLQPNKSISQASTPVGSPVVPTLPALQQWSPVPSGQSSSLPTSPRAFGHRPGQHEMYTMPVSPLAKRRAATAGKGKKGPGCLLPCLVAVDVLDKDPVEVGAGHPHVKLVDYKLKYDVGKQYDKRNRSFSEDDGDSILALKS